MPQKDITTFLEIFSYLLSLAIWTKATRPKPPIPRVATTSNLSNVNSSNSVSKMGF